MYLLTPATAANLDSVISEITNIDQSDVLPQYEGVARYLRGIVPALAQISGSIDRSVLIEQSDLISPILADAKDNSTSISATMTQYVNGSLIAWMP